MSKTKAECDGPCPMDQIRPGLFRCLRCGYEKDYRRRISPWVGVFWAIIFGLIAIAAYEVFGK